MIALFPLLWLHWQLVLHSFLTDKFLDNVSNKASVDSEEEDLEGDDETKDKLEYLDCNGTGSVEATNKILAIN